MHRPAPEPRRPSSVAAMHPGSPAAGGATHAESARLSALLALEAQRRSARLPLGAAGILAGSVIRTGAASFMTVSNREAARKWQVWTNWTLSVELLFSTMSEVMQALQLALSDGLPGEWCLRIPMLPRTFASPRVRPASRKRSAI